MNTMNPTTSLWIYTIVLAFCSILSHCSDLTDFLEKKLTKAVSGNTYVYVGDEVNITCVLPNSTLNESFTSEDIQFKSWNPFDGPPEQCLEKKYVRTVNTSTAVLTLPNATVDSDAIYGCYVNGCQEQVGVMGSTVKFEYRPHNVTNFRCVAYNWNEKLHCSWQHPYQYVNWKRIQVTTTYKIDPDQSERPKICLHSTNTSCILDSLGAAGNYTFTVTVTNIFTNDSTAKVFHMDTFQNVKPAPVSNLQIEQLPLQPDCLNISWQHDKVYRDKIFQVALQIFGKSQFMVLGNVSATFFKACDLAPYRHYNFSVEAYPTNYYSGYWSEAAYCDMKTFMTAPTTGPRTVNGSFTSSECKDGQREVTLMWQEVPESQRNGIIDGYELRLENKTWMKVGKDKNSTTVELPCYSYSEIQIFAHNEGGVSLTPSVLFIPPVTFKVPASIDFTVEMGSEEANASVRAIWNDVDEKYNRTIVFWCAGQLTRACRDEVHWKEVASPQTYYSITIEPSDADLYLFGISVGNQHDGMTGISWTDCLYQQNSSDLPPPKNMKVIPAPAEVYISWEPVHCSHLKVTGYLIKYCEVEKCNDSKGIISEEVPATRSSYQVSSLHIKEYKFTVQAMSDDIRGEEALPWLRAIPKEGRKNLTLELIGGFVGGFVFLFITVFIIWKCYKGKIRAGKLRTNGSFSFNDATFVPELPPGHPSRNLTRPAHGAQPDNAHIDMDGAGMDQDDEGCYQGNSSAAGSGSGTSIESCDADGIFASSGQPLVKPKKSAKLPKAAGGRADRRKYLAAQSEETVAMKAITPTDAVSHPGEETVPKRANSPTATGLPENRPVFSSWSNETNHSVGDYQQMAMLEGLPELSGPDHGDDPLSEESMPSYSRFDDTQVDRTINRQPVGRSTVLQLSDEESIPPGGSMKQLGLTGNKDHIVNFLTGSIQFEETLLHVDPPVEEYVTMGDDDSPEGICEDTIPKTLQDEKSVTMVTETTPAVLGNDKGSERDRNAVGVHSSRNSVPFKTIVNAPPVTPSIHDDYVAHPSTELECVLGNDKGTEIDRNAVGVHSSMSSVPFKTTVNAPPVTPTIHDDYVAHPSTELVCRSSSGSSVCGNSYVSGSSPMVNPCARTYNTPSYPTDCNGQQLQHSNSDSESTEYGAVPLDADSLMPENIYQSLDINSQNHHDFSLNTTLGSHPQLHQWDLFASGCNHNNGSLREESLCESSLPKTMSQKTGKVSENLVANSVPESPKQDDLASQSTDICSTSQEQLQCHSDSSSHSTVPEGYVSVDTLMSSTPQMDQHNYNTPQTSSAGSISRTQFCNESLAQDDSFSNSGSSFQIPASSEFSNNIPLESNTGVAERNNAIEFVENTALENSAPQQRQTSNNSDRNEAVQRDASCAFQNDMVSFNTPNSLSEDDGDDQQRQRNINSEEDSSQPDNNDNSRGDRGSNSTDEYVPLVQMTGTTGGGADNMAV